MIAPKDILKELPISQSNETYIAKARQEIRDILNGKDDRLLIIVGPCSIHNTISAMSYAKKLKQLASEVSDSILLVMRVYFEKPRTSLGWKGLLYDPHLNGTHDFDQGLRMTRQLLLDLADLEVPSATEFLTPIVASYLGDLIAWGCIGARTSASPIHRQLASGLNMPIGIKNSTSGNIETAVNGALVASHPHHHIDIHPHGYPHFIQTEGNPDAHIVLRGGAGRPNYDTHSIEFALRGLEKVGLPARLLIDCSHDNSYRNHENQTEVFQTVLQQILDGNRNIKGLALESNLKGETKLFFSIIPTLTPKFPSPILALTGK